MTEQQATELIALLKEILETLHSIDGGVWE